MEDVLQIANKYIVIIEIFTFVFGYTYYGFSYDCEIKHLLNTSSYSYDKSIFIILIIK